MTDLKIDAEFKALIPPLTSDEFQQLEENVLRDGIQDPLKVWKDTLVDGHNRYEIAQRHGLNFTTTELQFSSRDDVIIWIIKNQFGRRNLSAYDRSLLALKLKPFIAAKAKENSLSNLKQNQNTDVKISSHRSNKPSDESIKTVRENKTNYHVAKQAGVSEDTIRKVEKIEQAATPEIKAALKTGELSINAAYKDIKRKEKEEVQEVRRIENAAKVQKIVTPLDALGLFQTIVIDPPWDWSDEGDINQLGRAKPEYATIPFDKLKTLPIKEISDKNCHLYLWVTNRSLPKGFALINEWGFRYITCLTWVKPSFGMGNYFRGSTEQVLFAIKGSQPLKRHDVGTHFNAPRGNYHSSKPDEFYKIVESCSYAPFIDVFGRVKRENWIVWGENEIEQFYR